MRSEWMDTSIKSANQGAAGGILSQRQAIIQQFAQKMFDNPKLRAFMNNYAECTVHATFWESAIFEEHQNNEARYITECNTVNGFLEKLQNSPIDIQVFLKSYQENEQFRKKLGLISKDIVIQGAQENPKMNELALSPENIGREVEFAALGLENMEKSITGRENIIKAVDLFLESIPQTQDFEELVGILADRMKSRKPISEAKAEKHARDTSLLTQISQHRPYLAPPLPQITKFQPSRMIPIDNGDASSKKGLQEFKELLQAQTHSLSNVMQTEEDLINNNSAVSSHQAFKLNTPIPLKPAQTQVERNPGRRKIVNTLDEENTTYTSENFHPSGPLKRIKKFQGSSPSMSQKLLIQFNAPTVSGVGIEPPSKRTKKTKIQQTQPIFDDKNQINSSKCPAGIELCRSAFRETLAELLEKNLAFKSTYNNFEASEKRAVKIESTLFDKTKGVYEVYTAESEKYIALFIDLQEHPSDSEKFIKKGFGVKNIEDYLLRMQQDEFKTYEAKSNRGNKYAKKNDVILLPAISEEQKFEESDHLGNLNSEVEPTKQAAIISPGKNAKNTESKFVPSNLLTGQKPATPNKPHRQSNIINQTQEPTAVKQNPGEQQIKDIPVIKFVVPGPILFAKNSIFRIYKGKLRSELLKDTLNISLCTCHDFTKISELPDIHKEGTINGVLEVKRSFYPTNVDNPFFSKEFIVGGWVMCNDERDKQKLLDYSNKLHVLKRVEGVTYPFHTKSTSIYITNKQVISPVQLEKLNLKSQPETTGDCDSGLIFIIRMNSSADSSNVVKLEPEIMKNGIHDVTKGAESIFKQDSS